MRSSDGKINRRYNKKDVRTPLVIILGALLILLIVVMPKQPVNMAVNGAGLDSSLHRGLELSEIMSDNASTLPDDHGLFGDWVEIVNTTDGDMNIKNVGLSDRSDRIKFLFPDMSLAPGERVVVFCDDTNANEAGSVLHAKMKLSSYGDTVFLFDASGVAIDHVTVPTLNQDESYCKVNGEWVSSNEASPGFPNTIDGHLDYLKSYQVNPGAVVINEIMAAPRSGLRDEDGELSDWIELYNTTDTAIDLSQYALSDDDTRPVKWTFPAGAVIAPHGYYLVFCSGKNKLEAATLYPHTNFAVSAERETIVLSSLTGQLMDRVTIDNLPRDMTYGRDPYTLEWKVFTLGTPGAPNNISGAARADEYLRAKNPYSVYITEVMSSADAVVAVKGERASDYVELYNAGSAYVDVSGWGLSDNINWPRKWTFPQGAVIYPGEYKVILLDKSASAGSDASRLHASFALSSAGGEMMTLSDSRGEVVDRLYVPRVPTDYSYGRSLGKDGFFYYDAPTPGQGNGTGFTGFSEKPSFSVAGGLYEGQIDVEVLWSGAGQVRYTLDGSIPTMTNSQVYTGPFHVTATSVIRARVFESGLQPSETVSVSYVMNTYYTLDVVSLIVDPDELWNPEDGLFTVGDNVDKSKGIPFRNTIYRKYGKINRPGYVEYLLQSTGRAVFSQAMKIDLMGAYSLDMPQKSMKIRAAGGSGSKYFEYPLFEDRPYTFYKSFTLRNSGNDCVWTRVSDGVQSRLIDKYIDTDIITLAWKPVLVYINGTYWGHFNMRERKDAYCIAQHEGLPLDQVRDINIIRANSSVVQGTNTDYLAMRDRIKESHPNISQEDRAFLDENIDVDNYLDWFSIKMFFGDSDPGNILFYRLPTKGSRWKCLIFDMDYGLFRSYFDSPASYIKETGMGQEKINNVIFRKILEVDEYRVLFYRKMGAIYQVMTTEVMQKELDECVARIETEMPIHFERWAEYNDRVINFDSPLTSDGTLRYWRERVRRMREETMVLRPYWIYTLFQQAFGLSTDEMNFYFGSPPPVKPET